MNTWKVLIVPVIAGSVMTVAFAQEPGAQDAALSAAQRRFEKRTPEKQKTKDDRIPCPGSFPTDLNVTDCSFKPVMRLENLVTNSLTDRSLGGAAFYSLVAQGFQSPSEWHRTWKGYGLRVGVRYNQAVAKGTAQFLAGSIIHDDPRHVSYDNDPHHYREFKGISDSPATGALTIPHKQWKRVWHAVFDSVTVPQSSSDGLGRRLPAFSRFIGDIGSAYGGYAWYPGPENRLPKAAQRAAGSLGSDLASSFYTEYKPEITKILSRVGASLKIGGKPAQ